MGISNRERDEDVDEIRRVLGIGKCVVVLRFLFNLLLFFFIDLFIFIEDESYLVISCIIFSLLYLC